MKLINVGHGKQAIIDDCDYELVTKFKSWRIKNKNGYYAISRKSCVDGKNHVMSLSRYIMSPIPYGMEVDHINNNPLDNRRRNLRICTRAENSRNRLPQRPGKFKGVHKSNKTHWIALIKIDKYLHYLGSFSNPIDAATAYNNAAIEKFGQYAKINKINPYKP